MEDKGQRDESRVEETSQGYRRRIKDRGEDKGQRDESRVEETSQGY